MIIDPCAGSDEEIEFAATEASGASSAASDLKDTATQPGSPPIHEAAASAMEEEGTRPNEFRTAAQINSPFSAMEESEGGAECDLSGLPCIWHLYCPSSPVLYLLLS